MKFSAIAISLLAAVAQAVQFTNSAFDVQAGKPFTLTWSGASGPVTIKLKNGPNTNLKDVATVTSGATGTSFVWSVPANLPADTYAFEIDDSTGVPNYSVQFTAGSGTATLSSSAASSSAASTSTVATTSQTVTTSSASAATTSASTTRSSSSSRTATSSTTAATTTVPGSSGQRLSSPLALILVTIAAMLYFH
jgi:hypothetical protein